MSAPREERTQLDARFKQYRTVFIQVLYVSKENKYKETCRQKQTIQNGHTR